MLAGFIIPQTNFSKLIDIKQFNIFITTSNPDRAETAHLHEARADGEIKRRKEAQPNERHPAP